MVIGNNIAINNPTLILPLKPFATMPTIVGPDAQPKSPASAISAYIAVPAVGITFAAMLKVPGQNIPTENPHRAHPISPKIG